uniref:Cytochrome c oxidase subunit 2 n=1 Tax=Encyrtus sasakii TaxID=1914890 RepID=A0A7S5FK66_9HYME|nr:cytochrome c oxidase subunit II [Encyrtus sasakii]QGA47457.1 cytochrome c oxidase subunit II [Encyrtus sasakii]QGA47470.1 cytochrome c oxidase subunit II [Encyrtus sasakii]QGA74454.1 cytochrome c oxidase subunit II [Encyrtus sasakii]
MSIWGNLLLQDGNSSIMENLILFHDHAMVVIMMILMLILYFFIFMLSNKFLNRFMFEGQVIEIIWTVVPVVLLVFLAVPSLKILYLSDEIFNSFLSFKVLGHQWYWSYEYNDFKDLNFDSFMLSDSSSSQENLDFFFRLLDVDNRFVVPMNLNLRVLVSSLDVIHSFALPSIGIKIDAVPGRLNQVSMNLIRPGVYFGQCSEICGVNHSFMPVVLEVTSINNFLHWINNV